MRYVVNFFYLLGALLGLPFFIYKMMTAGKYRRGLAQRLGAIKLPPGDGPVVWVHAVSVGELQAARPLIEGLRKRHPSVRVVISHTTRTGEEVAAKLYPDLFRFYFPLDFSWVVAKVMRRLNPALIVLVELELWPNFLTHAARKRIPVFLANGRISARSATGYRRNAWFFRQPFSALTRTAVQNEEYRGRLAELFRVMELGDRRIDVAGNIKYDNVRAGVDEAARTSYRKLFGFADDEVVLVCGSTHPGEHEMLAPLYKALRDQGVKLRMVLVPRHPERWSSVRELFRKEGIPLVDRSTLGDGTAPQSTAMAGGGHAPCILLDTMGELSRVYNAADVVFIGGSLIPHGGQNMIESVGLGRATLFGPHTENFRGIVRDLLAARGAIQVQDSAELRERISALCNDADERNALGQRGMEVVREGQGAVERHLAIVDEMMEANAAHVHRAAAI